MRKFFKKVIKRWEKSAQMRANYILKQYGYDSYLKERE